MSKLFRALLISAIATGAAAVAMKLVRPVPPAAEYDPTDDAFVRLDDMTGEEQDALLRELAEQL